MNAAVAAEQTTWHTMGTGGEPNSEVDILADVALLGEKRRARVQTNANLDPARGMRLSEG